MSKVKKTMARLATSMLKLTEALDRQPIGTAVIVRDYAFHLLLGELVVSPIMRGAHGRMLGAWMRGADHGMDASLAMALEEAIAEKSFVNLNKYLQDGGNPQVA